MEKITNIIPAYKNRRSIGDVIRHLNRSKRVSRSKSGTFALILILVIFAVFMAIPMVYVVANSFKPQDEFFLFPPRILAQSPTLKNYKDMFTIMTESEVPFLRYIFNTVFITVVATAGHIILSSMCAFPLAKKKFPGRKLIFNLIVYSLMFNATVTATANYIVMSGLDWLDTYAALIVPPLGSTLGLYLMKQFMEQIPDALLESARIDGANQWIIFWRIVMPNVKSAWLTVLLLSVQSIWPQGASDFVYREELKTLGAALNQIQGATGSVARAGVGAAVVVIMMIVPITIFVVCQSNIIDTMASSGMKD